MTKLIKVVILMAAVLTSMGAGARVWRVNPNPNSGAEYTTVAQLHDNYDFVAGDTILLDPGYHGSITINRENITIMGTGYFLGQNEEFAMQNTATLYDLALSNESKAIGLYVSHLIYLAHNVFITRCYIDGFYYLSEGGYNSEISNNYINGSIDLFYRLKNSVLRNNIIKGCIYRLESVDILNNTIVCECSGNDILYSDLSNCTIQNNIIINTKEGSDESGKPWSSYIADFATLQSNNNNVSYNVFSTPERFADQTFTVGNKYCGATVENTFVWEGSEDGKFRLKEGSPAKGASSNGGDCGAFGGALPYVLSGIPAFMPRITNASIPDSPTDGKISVTLTIHTQNE